MLFLFFLLTLPLPLPDSSSSTAAVCVFSSPFLPFIHFITSPSSQSGLKANPRWTTEEQLLAVQAFRKYGKNFKSIAELLGTKSELHVRNFYLNNDKKFGLSNIVKEFQEQIDQQ